ncbi:MAG: AAA family ATPase, partial [Cyanobacteria bacterium P01_D01_bin.50]
RGTNGQRRDFTTEDILWAIKQTVPLAAIACDRIEDLKRWAAQAGARTASNDQQVVEEIKQYTQKLGMLKRLEVD